MVFAYFPSGKSPVVSHGKSKQKSMVRKLHLKFAWANLGCFESPQGEPGSPFPAAGSLKNEYTLLNLAGADDRRNNSSFFHEFLHENFRD